MIISNDINLLHPRRYLSIAGLRPEFRDIMIIYLQSGGKESVECSTLEYC